MYVHTDRHTYGWRHVADKHTFCWYNLVHNHQWVAVIIQHCIRNNPSDGSCLHYCFFYLKFHPLHGCSVGWETKTCLSSQCEVHRQRKEGRQREGGRKTDRDTGDIILLLLSRTRRGNRSFLCRLKSTVWQVNPSEYIKGGLIPTQINIYREEHDCWKCHLKTTGRDSLSDRLAPALTDAPEVVSDELSCFSGRVLDLSGAEILSDLYHGKVSRGVLRSHVSICLNLVRQGQRCGNG